MPARSPAIVALAVLLGLGGPLCDAACAAVSPPQASVQQHQAAPPCHGSAHEPAPAGPGPLPAGEDCSAPCDAPAVAQAAPAPESPPVVMAVALSTFAPPRAAAVPVPPVLRGSRLPPPDILLRKSTLNL